MSTPDSRATSALPLLVTWVIADDHHPSMATYHLALLTHRLHAWSYLHRFLSLSNSVRSTACCRILAAPCAVLVSNRLTARRPLSQWTNPARIPGWSSPLFVAVGDPSPGEVVGRDLHLN